MNPEPPNHPLENDSVEAELLETTAVRPGPVEEAAAAHGTDAVTTRAVQRQMREYLRTDESRRRQFPRAVLVGLLAGLLGVAFRYTLAVAENWRTGWLIPRLHHHWWGLPAMMLIGIVGSAIAVMLVHYVAPEASGSGIPDLKAVLHRLRPLRWRRILPVKFIGGVTGIGAGLALGREGPTIQMGGAIGGMVSEWLDLGTRERQTLIAAGAGAGLAAAFNAPLAGMVFVLEEVQRDFTPTVFGAALVASVVADVVARLLMGQNPVFHVTTQPFPPVSTLPAFLLLGGIAGLLGVLFNRTLLVTLNFFSSIQRVPPGVSAGVVGALIGVIAWLRPDVVGGGYPLLDHLFGSAAFSVPFGYIVAFFVLRFLLTMLSYGSGAPGGIFAPLLVLGALVGEAMGYIAHVCFPRFPYIDPSVFAVVGMGAYFSGIVRAPLTGIVLIIEMTLNYSLMLPLLVACLSAYALADWLGDQPVYEALLERDLMRGQDKPELSETLLLELTVQPGSAFDGKRVRDLGLPHGCILVTIHRGLDEEVPGGNTVLEAGDRLTAVIAPQAADGVMMLREGTEARRRE